VPQGDQVPHWNHYGGPILKTNNPMKTQKKPTPTIDKDKPTKRPVQSYEPTPTYGSMEFYPAVIGYGFKLHRLR